MKKLLMLLLCLTIPLTFLISCGEKKQMEEEAEQQVEPAQEEVVEEVAPDTAVAVEDTTTAEPEPEE